MAIGGLGSSVFIDPEAEHMFGEAEIELRDIDQVLSSLSIDRIDLIKINIEGGEYELIDRLRERAGWHALGRSSCSSTSSRPTPIAPGAATGGSWRRRTPARGTTRGSTSGGTRSADR